MLISSVICGVLGGVTARAIYKPVYTVTQSFTIELKEYPNANQASISDNQLSKTLPSLMSSETFMEYMVKFVKEKGANGRFMVSSLSNSNIFNITVEGDSNEDCISILDIFEEHYADLTEKVVGESKIKFFTEPITSPLPSNAPSYVAGAVIGAGLSIALFIAILVIKTMTTKTILDSAEAEELLNAKCLAEIKEIRTKKRSDNKNNNKNNMPLISDESADLELKQSINTLTMNVLQKTENKGYKTILLTSTISGEGKTSVSVNLATNLAILGKTVIIVDCDLRSPSVATHLDTKINTSLSSVIEGNADIKNAITSTNTPNLDMLGNADTDANASENVADKRLADIIDGLKAQYDYVIIDTPPVGFLGDGLSLSDAADAFVYVVSHNYVNTSYVTRNLSSFDGANAKMLGFVINHKQ